jgi:2-C-methyl-D-erythritol 4-phosphate cytidylyltransferase
VPGEARNHKITDPSDLALVGAWLEGGQP